ncbi:MAG: Gfo/Idh/MocA family protein, partial [Terrimicrobiaceae bacterium]
MSVAPIRLAILGSGNIAATHAAAIARVPEARLVAVCSRNPEKATALAAPAKAQIFQSVDTLLAANIVDALLIATPSGAHTESVLPALRAGRHVLCEKPVEVQTARISVMIDEAERRGLLLAGFFPLRFGAGAVAIRRALDAGRFGRVTFLSARIKWWRDQDYYDASSWRGTWKLDGGGALMNQGIHAVDLLQWFGGAVTEVNAYSGTVAHPKIEVEDTLAASLRFAHGGLGTLSAATSCYPGLDLSLEVSGDAGTAVLVNDRIEFWRFHEELPEDESIRKNESAGSIRGGTSNPLAISSEGHRRQIEAFCRAIRGGDTAEIIDGREASRAVAIIEGM